MKLVILVALAICTLGVMTSPGEAWGRTAWRVAKNVLRPTCAGCAGICEFKVRGSCACRVNQACLRRMRG